MFKNTHCRGWRAAYALGALLFLQLSSCVKDEQPTSIKGIISDRATARPVADATVSIYKIMYGSNGQHDELVTTCYTDANGQFSYVFPKESSASFHFEVTKENYESQWGAIRWGREYNNNIALTPYTFIEATIRDTSSVYHRIHIDACNCSFQSAMSTDSVILVRTLWDSPFYLSWSTRDTNDALIHQYSQPFKLHALDTMPVLLKY